jgi:hypothetical protein
MCDVHPPVLVPHPAPVSLALVSCHAGEGLLVDSGVELLKRFPVITSSAGPVLALTNEIFIELVVRLGRGEWRRGRGAWRVGLDDDSLVDSRPVASFHVINGVLRSILHCLDVRWGIELVVTKESLGYLRRRPKIVGIR